MSLNDPLSMQIASFDNGHQRKTIPEKFQRKEYHSSAAEQRAKKSEFGFPGINPDKENMKPDMYQKLEQLGAFKSKEKPEKKQIKNKFRKALEPVVRSDLSGPQIEIETIGDRRSSQTGLGIVNESEMQISLQISGNQERMLDSVQNRKKGLASNTTKSHDRSKNPLTSQNFSSAV